MKKFLLLILTSLTISSLAKAQSLIGYSEEKGVFSLAFTGGLTRSGLLNTNSNFSGYQVNNLGADLDFRLWGSGSGEFRFFISYLTGTGKGTSNTSDVIKTEETILGFKVSVNSYLYLTAGAGPGKINLSSSANNAEIKMTNLLTRMSLGADFPIGKSFFLGGDLSYRSGPIKKSENPAMLENSYYEGSAFLLKFTWSPPNVSNTFTVPDKYKPTY